MFIDDATSRLIQLRLVPSESTDSYFKALEGYLEAYGCPVAFYSDKHSVFPSEQARCDGRLSAMTQFGLALAERNVEILCANGPEQQQQGRLPEARP